MNRVTKSPSLAGTLGFTMLELLVVVGIVALLAGLLLPVLARSKQSGRQVECLNHHRQLALGWQLYSDNYQGRIPPNKNWMGGPSVRTNWVAGIMRLQADATNAALLLDYNESLLAEVVPSPKLYKCPADQSAQVRSVAMNHWLNPTNDFNGPTFTEGQGTNYTVYRNRAGIARPEETFVFIDERSDSINDAFFVADAANTGSPIGIGTAAAQPYFIVDYPSSDHAGAALVSFADGHAEAHRWVERTTNPRRGSLQPRMHTSTTDRDMSWLQTHATRRR